MMMRRAVMWATTLIVMMCASQAFAQGARSMAVLNIEGDGVDRDTADTLSAVVRSEAQQIAEYQVVNATPINLSEVVVLLGCDVTDVSCLNQAAEQLDASVLIYGSIVKEGNDHRLRLAIFDARKLVISHRMQEVITGSNDLVFDARQEIEAFFKKVRQDQIAAKLTISSNVRGASVLLNGESSGTTPLDELLVPPGSYKIEVKKEGFTEWSAELELGERANMKLSASLKPLPAAAKTVVKQDPVKTTTTTPSPTTGSSSNSGTGAGLGEQLDVRKPRKGVNVGAISLLSIGAVSLGVSAVYGVRMQQLSDDLNRRAANGELTPSERDEGIEQGLGFQRTHRVLLGVGAVGVLAGGVWLVTDLSRRDERKPVVQQLRLHVAPDRVGASVSW